MADPELDAKVLKKIEALIAADKLSEAMKIVFQLGFEKGQHDAWEKEEESKALLDGNQPS